MQQLSHWASQHRRTAIGLLVLVETVNVGAGMNLGRFGLPALPPDLLTYLTILVATGIFTVRDRHQRETPQLEKKQFQRRLRRDLRLVTLGSYALAILAGNACQNFYQDPGAYPRRGAVSLEMRRDTIRPATPVEVSEYYPESGTPTHSAPKGMGWKILGYALLGLLGLVAAVFASYLGCVLMCSGQGVLALLVLLAVAGGYPLLASVVARALRKDRKRLRDMTREDRRREARAIVFGLGLAALIAYLTTQIIW